MPRKLFDLPVLVCLVGLLAAAPTNAMQESRSVRICPSGAQLKQALDAAYPRLDASFSAYGILTWNERGPSVFASDNNARYALSQCSQALGDFGCNKLDTKTQDYAAWNNFWEANFRNEVYGGAKSNPNAPGLSRPPAAMLQWAERSLSCSVSGASAPSRPAPAQIGAASVAAPSGSSGEPRSMGDVERQAQPYASYPFPAVTLGQIWMPSRFKTDYTTIFAANAAELSVTSAERVIIAEANRLNSAGQKSQAIAYLEGAVAQSTSGAIELRLVNLLFGNDDTTMMKWLERVAEKSAFYYYRLGEFAQQGKGIPVSQQLALHYWSKGLSRGCSECFDEIYKVYLNRAPISHATMIDYAAVAVDIGNSQAIDRLYDLISAAPDASPRASILKSRATTFAGGETDYRAGLALAVFENYRSGLVSDRLTRGVALARVDGDLPRAIDEITRSDGYGRYFRLAAAEILSIPQRSGKPYLGEPGQRFAIVKAALWGERTWSLAAAAILGTPGESYMYDDARDRRKLAKYDVPNERLAVSLTGAARAAGLPVPMGNVFVPGEGLRLGYGNKGLVASAKQCVDNAFKQKTDYWQFAYFRDCMPTILRLWDNTYYVDAVPMDNFRIGRLSAGQQQIAN